MLSTLSRSMATIGRLSAVTESFGMRFTGVIGYTMWGLVHVLYLVGWAIGSVPSSPGLAR